MSSQNKTEAALFEGNVDTQVFPPDRGNRKIIIIRSEIIRSKITHDPLLWSAFLWQKFHLHKVN